MGCRSAFARRIDAIDHRAAYFQIHFALDGLPEYAAPYEVLNEGGPPPQRDLLRDRRTDAAGLRGLRPRASCPSRPHSTCPIPTLRRPGTRPPGEACGQQLRLLLPHRRLAPREQARFRDEMAARIVAKITAMAPNFPDLIERQFNYPAYTYELMFGCTGGDFTHGLLQPEFMGPFRPGPGAGPTVRSRSRASTSAAPAATVGPASRSSRATTAATPCWIGELPVVADLALDECQVEGHGEGQAGEEAHHEEDPGDAQSPPATVRRSSTGGAGPR